MFEQALTTNDIERQLQNLNEELRKAGKTASIIVVGGASLSLQQPDFRVTTDIDYLGRVDLDTGILETLNFSNIVMSSYSVPDLEDISYWSEVGFSNLDVRVMSLEDVGIMKTYSTRVKDYHDLVNYVLPNLLDICKFKVRLDKYKATYWFNINDPTLNLNQWDFIKRDLYSLGYLIVDSETQSFGDWLKDYEIYSQVDMGLVLDGYLQGVEPWVSKSAYSLLKTTKLKAYLINKLRLKILV